MNDPRSSRAGKARIGALGFTAIAFILSILSAVFLYSILAKEGYGEEHSRTLLTLAILKSDFFELFYL